MFFPMVFSSSTPMVFFEYPFFLTPMFFSKRWNDRKKKKNDEKTAGTRKGKHEKRHKERGSGWKKEYIRKYEEKSA